MENVSYSNEFEIITDEVYRVLTTLTPDPLWTSSRVINQTADRVFETLEGDLKTLHGGDLYHDTAGTITAWHDDPDTVPSLLALVLYGCETAIDDSEVIPQCLLTALMMTAILGEVPNTLAYHNPLHYKKVMVQMLRMIRVSDNDLSHNDKMIMLMAVCIHDLGHTGNGNRDDRDQYIQGYLEHRAYALAMKYIHAVTFDDATMRDGVLHDLRVILMCTDVSEPPEGKSFADQMKCFYQDNPVTLDPVLYGIKNDARLLLMALMVHEADIATSAAVSYDITAHETALFYRETEDRDATPDDIKAFLTEAAQTGFLSPAGRAVFDVVRV